MTSSQRETLKMIATDLRCIDDLTPEEQIGAFNMAIKDLASIRDSIQVWKGGQLVQGKLTPVQASNYV